MPLTLLVVLALVLAACGGGSDDSSSSAADREPSTPEAAADVEADPAGILRFGAMRATSLDPMRTGTQTEYPYLNVIFDTLLTTDPDTGEFEPRLATDWEVQEDRIRLTLRDDVVFQDGTTFDAEAVKFSIERAMNDPESNISATTPQVAGVEVVDPTTVDILMDPVAPITVLTSLADRLGMIVSPTAVEAAGDSTKFSEHPVGTGMYAVTGEWFPRESLSVRAWDGYWDEEAALLGGIDFTEVAAGSQLNALRSGSVDLGSYQGADVAAIESQPDLRVAKGYSPLTKGLVVNLDHEPLDDLKVRQAISHSIDREAVVRALTQGFGRPAHQPFPEGTLAYDPDFENPYPFDLDRAKELLAEAGYPDGVGFKAVIGSAAAAYVQFGQVIQGQMKKAGIDMDLQLIDSAQVIGMVYGEGSVPASPLATSGATPDLQIRLSYLEDGPTNASKDEVPGVRPLYEAAARSTSAAEAAEHYREINHLVSEGLYSIIPVYNEPALTGYAEYVGGITRAFTDVYTHPDMFRGIFITKDKVPATAS